MQWGLHVGERMFENSPAQKQLSIRTGHATCKAPAFAVSADGVLGFPVPE